AVPSLLVAQEVGQGLRDGGAGDVLEQGEQRLGVAAVAEGPPHRGGAEAERERAAAGDHLGPVQQRQQALGGAARDHGGEVRVQQHLLDGGGGDLLQCRGEAGVGGGDVLVEGRDQGLAEHGEAAAVEHAECPALDQQ